jgi:hypothetical protein
LLLLLVVVVVVVVRQLLLLLLRPRECAVIFDGFSFAADDVIANDDIGQVRSYLRVVHETGWQMGWGWRDC